jgi:hypothetical protein
MKESQSKEFDQLLHPYVFVLKEGKEIQTDFLDYSLLLLQVGRPTVLPSPKHKPAKSSTPFVQLLKI